MRRAGHASTWALQGSLLTCVGPAVCMQCLPVPAGFKPAALAADMPVVTSFAAALNTQATCTQYVRPGGQCGGSAGACYGAQCAVRELAPLPGWCYLPDKMPGLASLKGLLATRESS